MATHDLTVAVPAANRRPRVLIIGCGFGGLFAARALTRSPVEVLVVDRNNYHLFQPLLYQVASAALAPADIAQPIRTILRGQANAFVMLGDVTGIALAQGGVDVGDTRLSFDYLILAPGAVDNYFGHPEWHQWAPGMKEVEDATFIRSRLLLSFETAELEGDTAQRAAHLAFVIVGGGPTGVELAGAIKELAVDVIARDFRVADTRRARVILIEAGPRLLPALHPKSSAHALAQLKDLGVEVRLGQPVTQVFEDGVEVGGERVRSCNVIWYLVDSKSGRAVPGVSQGALQMGRYVARVITEDAERSRTLRDRGFHYVDWGSMATIGKSRAVVEIGPLRFGGLLAWLAWMFLHVSALIGFRNRISVMTSWIYGYVFSRRGSRLITRSARPS